MTHDESYNGWTNRETWAVALYINNDQGWQESVHEDIRQGEYDHMSLDDARVALFNAPDYIARRAGEIIRDNVDEWFESGTEGFEGSFNILRDIGSLWRVNWDELGAAFLSDLAEDES